ncbi:ribonuclease [Caballeronia sp. ATUFL_M2_KS44]|uniref:ribonuclease n=1 Tax=Caballeronia sp. ATUFL_M2_KS44 TaxID=2921767 RepID=UPI0020285626|nr:ribonuclease [Caballeronia sp. ATUFL_M2_KS44]
MKRAWTVLCMFALSAALCGCGKKGSQDAAQESGASASQASSEPQASSDAVAASGALARGPLASVGQKQLPDEAVETLRLIKAGGPYPFSEDGVLFRNSATLLPQHARGYYHAYTVRTPGAANRGQRRIVCGGPRKQTGDCYYTDDYYVSFKRIAQ